MVHIYDWLTFRSNLTNCLFKDYLFVAKREEEGEHLTVHEEQSEGYATAKLKYLNNEKLSFHTRENKTI
ncbi:hypothetical protein SAMN05660816_05080 [Niastella yeongjuensis]|nr:hypothetical protein SAMN05660816_05080 [Niastella yeongjuensis]